MNSRKFYLIFSSTICTVLFVMGLMLLLKVNLNQILNNDIYSSPIVDKIIFPLKKEPKAFNILVMGGDNISKNSDSILVVNVNSNTNNINIMSIPRDTRVLLNGHYQKVNAAYPFGGQDYAVKTISNLTNIDIDYYVVFDTSIFKETIDILGGVDFYIPEKLDYDDPLQNLRIHLKKGQQHLTGEKAEQLMRYRQSNTGAVTEHYNGSDLSRISMQQAFIKELIQQKADISYLPKLKNVLDVVMNNVETNLPIQEILKLAGKMTKIESDSIKTFTLPGYPIEESPWYYICNSEETAELVRKYFK